MENAEVKSLRSNKASEVGACLEKCTGTLFFGGGGIDVRDFSLLEKRQTQSIKRYKLFLAAASEDRIGFSNDFPTLPATLYKKFLEL